MLRMQRRSLPRSCATAPSMCFVSALRRRDLVKYLQVFFDWLSTVPLFQNMFWKQVLTAGFFGLSQTVVTLPSFFLHRIACGEDMVRQIQVESQEDLLQRWQTWHFDSAYRWVRARSTEGIHGDFARTLARALHGDCDWPWRWQTQESSGQLLAFCPSRTLQSSLCRSAARRIADSYTTRPTSRFIWPSCFEARGSSWVRLCSWLFRRWSWPHEAQKKGEKCQSQCAPDTEEREEKAQSVTHPWQSSFSNSWQTSFSNPWQSEGWPSCGTAGRIAEFSLGTRDQTLGELPCAQKDATWASQLRLQLLSLFGDRNHSFRRGDMKRPAAAAATSKRKPRSSKVPIWNERIWRWKIIPSSCLALDVWFRLFCREREWHQKCL